MSDEQISTSADSEFHTDAYTNISNDLQIGNATAELSSHATATSGEEQQENALESKSQNTKNNSEMIIDTNAFRGAAYKNLDDSSTAISFEVAATSSNKTSKVLNPVGQNLKRGPPSPSILDSDIFTKKSKVENNLSLEDGYNTASVHLEATETKNDMLQTKSSADGDPPDAAHQPKGESSSKPIIQGYEHMEPSIAQLIQAKLEPIIEVIPLIPLSLRDLAELENSLQLGDRHEYSEDDGWKNDWSGNLQLFEKEVVVNQGYVTKHPGLKPITVPFHEWCAKSSVENAGLRGLELLLSYVYHTKGCPQMAQKILAHALGKPASSMQKRLEFITDAIRRITFDPVVLDQDGWTTKKAESPEGSMGGAFLIGQRVIWQKYEAIIIAFTLDEAWGSLWKAVWIEDLETFDMEADEVKEALLKYEKRQARIQKRAVSANIASGSTRKQATARFLVEGIEHGIVLALSKASKGVMWPARVMHVSEITNSYTGSRRNSTPTKAQVQVVFLAPFWNGTASGAAKADASDPFSLGPYFEIDIIHVTDVTLKKYPFDKFSIEDFKSAFRFLGLPKAALSRYLDANRIAMALKTYASKHITTNYTPGDEDAVASASLTGSHAMSVLAPLFPQAALQIPFDFILGQMPRGNEHASILIDDDDAAAESVIDIKSIIDAMTVPLCFGRKVVIGTSPDSTPEHSQKLKIAPSPNPNFTPLSQDSLEGVSGGDLAWSINNFASELLVELFETSQSSDNHSLSNLAHLLTSLLVQMRELSNQFNGFDNKIRREKLFGILRQCLAVKGYGEDNLANIQLPNGFSATSITTEWRKACERIYKGAVSKLRINGSGNGHTAVISDSRCNGHLTAENAFERPVRLPAAIKGAKMAGAGTNPSVLLVNAVEDAYVTLAEEKIIPKAHQRSYTKRLKTTISSIPENLTGVQLTDDSEGEGGDDTKGSRGSYTAATVGVAVALKAVDMVVGGQCVNSFCAVRPPGHHAGRELHPMKAVSNGFCLFNAAACAAIYAATSQSQGGLGLRRICIIDFDLHHGNGTQDILCNTHDPRFLYVSWHAGGAHINGYEGEDSLDEAFHLPGSKTTEGIFPGRCGDTSPHDGVLNIPLGNKVTSTDVGTALVSKVLPRVETFAPDLIILSAGFDAHVNDPLGMGGLSATDFGHITEVVCQMAYKMCSGRIMSVLEGGYGVPCCTPRMGLFLPTNEPEQLLDLGDNLPDNMPDPVTNASMRQKLNKCHKEGFVECVKEHVTSFVKSNQRK